MRRAFASLRFRLIMLVLLAVVPSMFVIYDSAQNHRDDNRELVKAQALSYARIGAIEYANSVDAAESSLLPMAQILSATANLATEETTACLGFFAEFIKAEPRFLFAGAVLPDGQLICGSTPVKDAPKFTDSSAIKTARETKEFAVGSTFSFEDGQPLTIETAYPVISAINGTLTGMVVANINPAVISESVVSESLPAGSVVTVISTTGTILARFPEPERWVGQSIADSPTFPNLLGYKSGQTREATSLDGNPILVASMGLNPSGDVVEGTPLGSSSAILTVGIPSSEAFATVNAQMRRDMLLLGGVGIVAIVAAWFGSGFFIRQIQFYSHATQRVAEDVNYRTGPPYPTNELGTLGRSIDTMATTIQQRDSEIRSLNEGLERRIEERTAELVAANNELEAFSYSVSHDLRAPLRAISGFAQILVEDVGPTLDADSARQLNVVMDNARQMGDLVDDLLMFSRLSRQALSPALVPQWDIVQSVVAEVTESAERRPEVVIGDLPSAHVDSRLFRQVWVNLIANAAKFSAKAESPRIEIGAKDEGGEDVFFVRDNGVGFDMQYAGKLFGVFQRMHRAEDYEGTGVGLAIVQRIVHRHGGRVWADARPGEGATFYFTVGKGAAL